MTDQYLPLDDPHADRRLWDEIAAIPVPPPSADFRQQLESRLAAASPRGSVAFEPHSAASSPGRRVRPRHGRRLLLSLVATAAVAAIAVAMILGGRHTVRELQHPPVASAAEVAANVKKALGSVTTISATSIRSRERMCILATADGRMLLRFPSVPRAWAITDLAAGTKAGFWPNAEDLNTGRREDYASMASGCPLGPPDRSDQDSDDIDSHLFALWFQGNVMSVMAHGTVTETNYEGRPALTVIADAEPSVDSPFDAVEVTVDRAAWFPVRVRYLRRGKVREEERLTNLRLNEPISDESFAPSFPSGAEVVRRRATPFWRHISFAEAAQAFSPAPLAPHVLPPDFAPFAAAETDRAQLRFIVTTANGGHDERYWSWSRDITALAYRAGFLTFVVTTRDQATDDPLADPFATLPELAARGNELETVTLESGALRGVKAQLAMPALNTPHLWAYKDGRLITVSGDLTRDQLLLVANSLEPLSADPDR